MPTCLYCQKDFEQSALMKNGRVNKHVRKFCSSRCKSYYGFKQKAAAAGEQTCLQCQKPFYAQWTPDSRFCSLSCSTTWSHANCWSLKPRTCKTCGGSFKSLRKDMKECPECRKIRLVKLQNARKIRKDPTFKIGCGSGCAQHYIPREARKNTGHKEGCTDNQRDSILTRDSFTCRVCNQTLVRGTWQVHHIDMNRMNNVDDNLISLCRNCHGVLHASIKERVWKGQVLSADLCRQALEEYLPKSNRGIKLENPGELPGRSEPKAVVKRSQGQRIVFDDNPLLF